MRPDAKDPVPIREGLPPDAKLVFKGVIFEIWQWEQEMFDGSTTTFERAWRMPTIEIIATVGDRVLVSHQSQPGHERAPSLLGGRAEWDEDILEAAKRELLEESGYISDGWELFFKEVKNGKLIHEQYCFIARNCQKVAEQRLDAGEQIEIETLPFEEFLSFVTRNDTWILADTMNRLKEARENKKKKEELHNLLFL